MSHDTIMQSGRKSNVHDEINDYIKRLSKKGFPISPRPRNESPKCTPMTQRPYTALIRYIYFQTMEGTRSPILENLVTKLETFPPSECTLEILQSSLQECKNELRNSQLSVTQKLKFDMGQPFIPTSWQRLRDSLPQSR